MYRLRKHPCSFISRRTNSTSVCLSSGRLAKYAMQVLTDRGTNTAWFKSHALRSATATFLLTLGVRKADVQAHRVWSRSVTALDDFHARLHLVTDWTRLLSTGRAEGMVRASEALSLEAVAALLLSIAPTASTEALRAIAEARQQQLSALGVPRDPHGNPPYRGCQRPAGKESAYRCQGYQGLFHIRCIHVTVDLTRVQAPLHKWQDCFTDLCGRCHQVQAAVPPVWGRTAGVHTHVCSDRRTVGQDRPAQTAPTGVVSASCWCLASSIHTHCKGTPRAVVMFPSIELDKFQW